MPPNGALNAAATPAAAPIPIHSRCGCGSLSSSIRCVPGHFFLVATAATIAPMWTIGPSLPSGKPDATTSVMPITLASSVRSDSIPPRTYVPLR